MDDFQILQKYSSKQILIEGYDIGMIREFLDWLGKPDEGMTIFHVGGTSGKGSTSTLLASIMKMHGLKTGLFVSPHVETVRERIQINNEFIEEGDLKSLVDKVLVEFKKFEKANSRIKRALTYFEILLVAALLYFQSEHVKYVVIEVGIGGKLDPTNVLFGKYCILTNVGLDHQKYLGDTVEEIAKDKVQIVKSGANLITGIEKPRVREIIKGWTEKVTVDVLWSDKEFDIGKIDVSLDGTSFDYRFGKILLEGLCTNLIGEHQAKDSALAITAFLKFAKDSGLVWETELINKGLKVKNFPARFEIKSRSPLIIWDGAHNADKMKALIAAVNKIKGDRKIKMLFALKSDKEVEGVVAAIKTLGGEVSQIVLTDYKIRQDIEVHSAKADTVKKVLNKTIPKVQILYNPEAEGAYHRLVAELQSSEILLVTGSFYLLSFLSEKLKN
ncbi:hypothetical protein JW978_02155 [Candidatus Dojkabacteria bacterium]|nr:hypothetical protein [Candidatus Dojkabacteria bacterium]